MAKARNKRPARSSPPLPTRSRRIRPSVLVCGAAVAALGLGWYGWYWYSAPAPPVVSLAEVDPEVAGVIESARREVWWHPHSAAAWARLGESLRAHIYQPESNFCFAQAERLDPYDPRWPYLQGLSQRSDDPEAALRHLQRAVALCGSVPDAPELCLAEVYEQQGHLDDAGQHFRHVLQHDPNNARAHLGLGRLAYERGNLADSLAHWNQSASDKRTQKASAILLAQVYHQLGDMAAAGRERLRAADFPNDPPWPDPFVEETRSLTTGKQFRLARLQALRQQGRAAELRPFAQKLENDYPDVYWLVEGRAQMDKGDLAAAKQALRKAIQLVPDAVEAHFDLGTVLFRQKNYRAAAESFQKVIELEPDYAPAYQCLGRCWMLQGNRAEAIRAFQVAASFMPQDAETHRELGRLLVEHGQVAEGQVQLRQTLQLRPGDTKTRALLDEASKRAP